MAASDNTSRRTGTSADRRSHRLLLHIPVRIRGRDLQQQFFQEETQTLVVNAHGGLVALAAIVRIGDKLILMNMATNEQQEGTVVFLGSMKGSKREVGIEFDKPAGQFWGVAFPPADWSPANLAAPEP